MSAGLSQPAHADVATNVASSAGWPRGTEVPLGTPVAPTQRATVLKIRVNAVERRRIFGRIPAGREFSEWARCTLATGSGEDTGAQRRELVRQLAAQGNLLNQVARALNKCALSGETVNALLVAAELRRIREALEALLP